MSGKIRKFALRNANAKIVRNNHNIKSLTPKDDIAFSKEPFFSSLQPEFNSLRTTLPVGRGGSRLKVACGIDRYSASRIAMACEDVDAQLIGLCVDESLAVSDGELLVDIHIDSVDATAAARSIERYGYRVVEIHHESDDHGDDGLSERIESLLTLLNV